MKRGPEMPCPLNLDNLGLVDGTYYSLPQCASTFLIYLYYDIRKNSREKLQNTLPFKRLLKEHPEFFAG